MNKCHQPITWHNDTTPALNETNLNYEDGCIDIIDDRVVAMDTAKLEAEDVATVIKNITFSETTGIFTFTRYDNSTFTLDTKLEKVVTNWTYDSSTQSLVLTLADGSTVNVPLSDFITETEFEDSATIGFTVLNHTVTAVIKGNSIGDAQMQTGYLTDCQAAASTASAAASTSNTNQLISEGFANGTQGGVPVSSGSPYYENNAKYWKEQAQAIASSTLSGLSDVSIVNPQDGQALVYDAGNSEWVNVDAPVGLLPHLILTSFTGSTVTISKGGTTITATETSSGVFQVDADDYGTWTITVTLSGDTNTDTITIDTVKIYTKTVYPLPNGSTATPTDVIQTWLHCANIWDKNYTTLAEVLADSTTLTALIGNNNAADYMARSTTWASDVCADSTAMSYIGFDNYCSDTLLGNNTWLAEIVASSYMESILNVKVPTMTGYNTPSGNVIYDSDVSGFEAWKAFDGSTGSGHQARPLNGTGATQFYIGYEFTTSAKFYYFTIKAGPISSVAKPTDTTIQAYSQGAWATEYTFAGALSDLDASYIINGGTSLTTKLRFEGTRAYNSSTNEYRSCYVERLQFYGREDV